MFSSLAIENADLFQNSLCKVNILHNVDLGQVRTVSALREVH